MANTYALIASNTLGTNTSTVTFSSIPATYSDLVVKISCRSTATGVNGALLQLRINGLSTSIYYWTYFTGLGFGSGSTSYGNGTTYFEMSSALASAGNGANIFGAHELHFSNYAGSTNKILYATNGLMNNSATPYVGATVGYLANTGAITSLTFTDVAAGNFVTSSTFDLYGIKNT